MLHLILVSMIWAFSFGLIKGNLTGVDSNFVAFARMSIALLVFLPFLKRRLVPKGLALKLGLTGMLQYGIMYICVFYSFKFLQAYEVALFTILTPLYVTLVHDALRKRFNPVYLLAALVAVAGTAVISYRQVSDSDLLFGFMVVQASNIAFAFGQVFYRELMRAAENQRDHQVFAWLYAGAVLITGLVSAMTTSWGELQLSSTHLWTLLYLGCVASGIGFFWWNYGARRVSSGTLAVANNLKVPLAVAVSLIIFNEDVDLFRLLLGGAIIIAAMWLAQRFSRWDDLPIC